MYVSVTYRPIDSQPASQPDVACTLSSPGYQRLSAYSPDENNLQTLTLLNEWQLATGEEAIWILEHRIVSYYARFRSDVIVASPPQYVNMKQLSIV